ncbi:MULTISPECIES: MMPL family transporter [unclassified Streptomyces]|uniref:MMPL family transporter n=1 Tax=unclassified Streptomyces TaxID=2593676 RepID=UPI00225277C2|nr:MULTISPECIES: MMPL family transporter [unclassified Streptomyces]MCX4987905.1 MMPL family transporter [Streptomyces sp. NBC_00568]MCX5006963.1 MMPL family transporter [Streptomyces sp. NBC_00638]
MAAFLYRLGRLAFRRRLLVALLWAAVLAGVGFGAATAPAAPDQSNSMPGIESQKAFDLMEQRFPGSKADGASARVVFVAPDGEKVTTSGNRAVIEKFVSEASDGSQVASVVSPFRAQAVSEDASTAYATVTFKEKADDLTDADKNALKASIEEAQDSGLTVEVGGTALATQPEAGGAAEGIGIAIATLVLLITFGSLAAAGLPLLTAIIGVGVSMAAIMALASAFGLSSTTGTLATMLGLACGIDYAVFIVSRYREERARGHAPQEAAGLAVGTAGSAVVFAGLTVVIALAGLSVVGVPLLTKMGLAAAGAVAVGVVIALTLVPALLGFWPNAVLARHARKHGRKRGRTGGIKATGIGAAENGIAGDGTAENKVAENNGGTRWARFVLRRPLPVLLASVAGLGALAIPVTGLQLGTTGDEAKPTSTTERRAYDDLAQGFGPGFNGPLTIVVDARGADDAKAAVATIEKKISDTEGVVSVSGARFNPSGDTAVFSAVPAEAPTSEKTQDLVHSIRDDRPATEASTGAEFEVTGSTAMNIDIAQKMQDALIPYLVVVVGLAIVLLMIVFRSVLVPVKAAVGFLLSVLAALGSVVAVFQWGWGADLLGVETTGPIMSMMPIFLVGIVFGLAMDYEVFLVARMREAYVHGDRPEQAIVSGFRHSARVVVAAALIMMAVFSGFIGAGESMIKMIGFGLAIAVLFDAFVIRMAFVPAVLALLGKAAWWMPRRLDRILPKVDVEGEALSRLSASVPAQQDPAGRESARV